MLKDRILFTIKFFDLQNTPLTLSQLRNFLFNEPDSLKKVIDKNFEISATIELPAIVTEEQILAVIKDCPEIESTQEYYCLSGRTEIINDQFKNTIYREQREKLIQRFVSFLKFIPFVRGVAVGGSHSLGQSKKESDIDLFIILDPDYLWLSRILVTGYFQIIGHRRHGQKIRNRFCLNHYLAGAREVTTEKDPYNAMEYLRLKPLVYTGVIAEFLNYNFDWIKQFFPQASILPMQEHKQSYFQKFTEKIFRNFFGVWLNKYLGVWQMKRIMRGEPAVALSTELSFHSKARKFELLAKTFRS